MFGGHGYIREWGMEQFVRDARIAQIYEGTNGIQAMDLVGRKLAKDGGRGRSRCSSRLLARDIAERARPATRPGIAAPLEAALGHLQAATMWLAQNGMADPDNAGAGAYAYMQLMGLVSARLDVAEDGGGVRRLKDDAAKTAPSTRPSWRRRASMRAGNWSRRSPYGARSKPAPKASWRCPVDAF